MKKHSSHSDWMASYSTQTYDAEVQLCAKKNQVLTHNELKLCVIAPQKLNTAT